MKFRLKQIGRKIKEPCVPQEVAAVDGYHAYLCLFKGEYVTHKHPGDELFLCLEGDMEIETPEGTFLLKEGEGALVKKGMPHRSKARKKALLLMFERTGLQRQPVRE